MQFVAQQGQDDLATVYLVHLADGNLVECVESVQPPVPLAQKWVHIVSTLKGCPFNCAICDAGGHYAGRLTADEMVAQVEHMVGRRWPDGVLRTDRLKVQFARMGDPALNPAVIPAMEALHHRYGKALFPSISTVAPASSADFFERLVEVKDRLFGPRFQMQFSLHTTDENRRYELVPARTWSFAQMASYGERWHRHGERKVTLNFATPAGFPLAPEALLAHFSPDHFAVKLTPVNPTRKVLERGLASAIDPHDVEGQDALVASFRSSGYDTILSIGELAENDIGSNCGMYVGRAASAREAVC